MATSAGPLPWRGRAVSVSACRVHGLNLLWVASLTSWQRRRVLHMLCCQHAAKQRIVGNAGCLAASGSHRTLNPNCKPF